MNENELAQALLELASKLAATPEDIASRFPQGPKTKGLTEKEMQEQLSKRTKTDPGFLKYMQDQATGGHEAVADYIKGLLDGLAHSTGDDPNQTLQKLLQKLKHDAQIFSKAVDHTKRERRKAATTLVRLAQTLLNETR